MALTTPKRLSVAEFLALPEQGSPAFKQELLFGEVRTMARPTWEHNRLASRLSALIGQWANMHQLGDVSADVLVVLSESDEVVVAPDVVYLGQAHLDRLREGRVWGAPDLVVEVLSPGTEVQDRGSKMRLYHRYGVSWVWLVGLSPLHIEEYRWTEAGYLLVQSVAGSEGFRSELFEGLEIVLERI